MNDAAVLQRYGHRCSKKGFSRLRVYRWSAALSWLAIPSRCESAQSWLAAEDYERCLRLAQQVLQTHEEHLDGSPPAVSLCDRRPRDLSNLRCRYLERRPPTMETDWILGGLERLTAASGRAGETLRWARCLIKRLWARCKLACDYSIFNRSGKLNRGCVTS